MLENPWSEDGPPNENNYLPLWKLQKQLKRATFDPNICVSNIVYLQRVCEYHTFDKFFKAYNTCEPANLSERFLNMMRNNGLHSTPSSVLSAGRR